VKLGNEIAATTKCGVGGSREVMRTGTQGVHERAVNRTNAKLIEGRAVQVDEHD
jgi:hypothetical protein